MGFSTSASAAVIFVGVLISVGILYPAVSNGYERVSEASGARQDRMLRQQNIAVGDLNATYFTDNDTVVVTLENTGTESLIVNETELLLDGEIYPNATVEVAGVEGRTLWTPGEQLRFTVSNLSTAPDRAVVVTELGVSVGTEVTVA